MLSEEQNSTEKKKAAVLAHAQKSKQLQEMFIVITEQKMMIKRLYQEIKQSKNPQETSKLKETLLENQNRLFKLETSFDEIAMGGADISSPDAKKDEQKQDMQEKLLEIFEPMLVSLKRATEHPRKIEAVRAEIEKYEAKQIELSNALESLENTKGMKFSSDLQKTINTMHKRIDQQKVLYSHHLKALKTKLSEYESHEASMMDNMSDNTVAFFKGRGLNIIMAISGFVITMMFLLLIRRKVQARFEHVTNLRQIYLLRILLLLLGLFSAIMATLVALFIFYIRADWLMLTIFLLLLLGIGWSLKTYLPSFMDELKMMLNMGLVREEERVTYMGIPWKVETISMSATLRNPLLSSGEIRISLERLRALTAREVIEDEAWFPTSEGDYVLIDDDQYGRILFQSPEVVNISSNATAIKSYSTVDYLASNPINLSREGFAIFETIAIDHSHREQITTTIPHTLEKSLTSLLQKEAFYPHLKEIIVEYSKATRHSLELTIIAMFEGEAAENYHRIKRTLHRDSLNICNENGWLIPYSKIQIDLDKSSDLH